MFKNKNNLKIFTAGIILSYLIFGLLFFFQGHFFDEYDWFSLIGLITFPVYAVYLKTITVIFLVIPALIVLILGMRKNWIQDLRKNLTLTSLIALFMYILLIPFLFDCQISRASRGEDGYFLGKYTACYSKLVSPIGGRSYEGLEVPNADFKSFFVFEKDRSYAKDKDKVYYDYERSVCLSCITTEVDIGKGIPEADPSTFQVIGLDKAVDKNYEYTGPVRLPRLSTTTIDKE